MSIEINSITQNKINKQNNNKNAAFKSNPLLQDKVELSSKKKELSNGSKIGIGIGIATVIGLGIELTIGKGKHLKTIWEKVRGKKPPKKPDGNPKTNVLPQIADFKNIDEAKAWFDNFGIKTEFRDVSNSDLVHINKIAKDFAELDRLGVTVSKPDSLVISDWNKKNELIRLLTERNINPDLGFSYAWGYAPISTDGTINIFLNINKLSNIAKGNIVQHEIGHQSRHIEDSVLK